MQQKADESNVREREREREQTKTKHIKGGEIKG